MDLEKETVYEFAGGTSVPRFNEDSTYALMLLHDFLGLGPQAEVMKRSMQINRPYERWAATVWAGSRIRAWISWPVPFFESYWEIDLFVSYWNRVLKDYDQVGQENSIEKTLEPLVYGWIDAVQAVWTGKDPFSLRPDPKSTQIVHPLPWAELAKKVAALVTLAHQGVKEWLWRLAYFLSPAVTGLRQGVAEAFVAERELSVEWKESTEMITRYHQEIIYFFVDKKMNKLVGQLVRAVNEHLDVLFRKDGRAPSPSSKRTSRKAAHENGSKGTSRRPSPKQRGRG